MRWIMGSSGVVATAVVVVAAADHAYGNGIDNGHMFGWGWEHMIFGGLFMVLFWAAIIVGVVALARWLFSAERTANAGGDRDSALETLRERFARGEIDKDEFDERKRHLSSRDET